MARKHLLNAGDVTEAEATPSRNVLIYIRVSTEKQSQNYLASTIRKTNWSRAPSATATTLLRSIAMKTRQRPT
jgi:hypothetical protein